MNYSVKWFPNIWKKPELIEFLIFICSSSMHLHMQFVKNDLLGRRCRIKLRRLLIHKKWLFWNRSVCFWNLVPLYRSGHSGLKMENTVPWNKRSVPVISQLPKNLKWNLSFESFSLLASGTLEFGSFALLWHNSKVLSFL